MIRVRDLAHKLGGHFRSGAGSAPCPVCQSERRRDQHALSITEQGGRLLLHCFKSECSFADIVSTAKIPFDRARVEAYASGKFEKRRIEHQAAMLGKARATWAAAKPIEGTPGEKYLRSRGISCPLPASLRWTPEIHHAPSMTWCGAIVANVQPTGGIHRTYLDKAGNRLPISAKLMLGPCAGGAVQLSECVGPLVVCEGIETGLSLLSGLMRRPAAVWAALSTSGMKAVQLPDEPGQLVVGSDGDAPGRSAANALAQRAAALGWKVSLLPAPDGRDWNDELRKEFIS